jgi:hypothetical protein
MAYRYAALAWFSTIAVACSGGKTAERHAAAPSKTLADTGATTNPPAELSMDDQHRTMDSVQANYVTLMTAVTSKDKAGAGAAAQSIAAMADRIPVFMIHKMGVTPDSMQRWARMLKGQALRAAQLASADSLDAAMSVAGDVGATCQTCHDMYRVPESEEHHDEHAAPAKARSKSGAKK